MQLISIGLLLTIDRKTGIFDNFRIFGRLLAISSFVLQNDWI